MTLRTKLQNFTTPLTRNFQKGIEHKENQTKCRNRTRKPRSHVTHKFIPPPWHKGTGGGALGGGGGGWNPSSALLICCSILKRFYLWWKAFNLLNKMRYILGVVVLVVACDITNNGHHLGFYQELEIRLKSREMVLCMKNNTLTLNDFSHKIYFYYWKKLQKHVFSPKLAWPPATYDVISSNRSNWPSLHLSQNVHKGWMNSYWKCHVLMFYPLGKNSEKPYRGGGGGASTAPTPVRLRVNILNVGYSQAHEVEFSSWELFQKMGR